MRTGEKKVPGTKSLHVRALKEEILELRKLVGLHDGGDNTETAWDRAASPELRDRMAVRALLAEWGNPTRALARLGYEVELIKGMGKEARDLLKKRIFETEGVKRLLAEDLANVNAQRDKILGRQVQTALYGDDESSVRAAGLLAKITGWQPADAPASTTVNLYTLVGAGVGGAAGVASAAQAAALAEAARSSDPLALLSHDPGAPVRIDSGNAEISAALERDE